MNNKHHRTIAVFTTTTFAIGSLSLLFLPFNLTGCASTKKVTALEERLSQQENRIKELQSSLRASVDENKRLRTPPKTFIKRPKKKRAASVGKKVPAEDRRRSDRHYLTGVRYFQNGHYKEARTEWALAISLDFKNSDAAAGLKRVNEILGIAKKPLPPGGGARKTLSRTERKRLSQKHYLKGLILFQKGDYATARDEWKLSKYYDPKNEDAQAGLRRLEKLYGG